ncbi:uncharacterized protein LOC128219253 [Mya arenaria]|uniref:uncharacterized protein LOC128219253 n=1 Tax=Mya arenaria TaxID=6604 RepID=UPI0022E86786|nr:uncharacterized protein LOC128219253 [Mya arenaria]
MYTTAGEGDIPESLALLSRHKRDLKWSDVEDFYADKNNFAMYLVLPIIVIVYGGCAVIYCIARCRRYIRRRKKHPLVAHEETDDEPMSNGAMADNIPSIPVRGSNGNVPSIPVQREGAQTSSDVHVAVGQERQSPLPWQVPGDDTTPKAASGTPIKAVPPSNHYRTQNSFENKAYENDFDKKNRSPGAPPGYDESYKPVRPMSKPPPYEEKGISHRRGSVEEIITLESTHPPPKKSVINERKRPRSGLRSSSRASMKSESIDEDRERARQLVRGDRPPRREPIAVNVQRQRTPDIISHARTQPLKPQYIPPMQNNNENAKADAAAMARQAAQLLRLDQMERQVGKKKKRLVFVAE